MDMPENSYKMGRFLLLLLLHIINYLPVTITDADSATRMLLAHFKKKLIKNRESFLLVCATSVYV